MPPVRQLFTSRPHARVKTGRWEVGRPGRETDHWSLDSSLSALSTTLSPHPHCHYDHTATTPPLPLRPHCHHTPTATTTTLPPHPHCHYDHTVTTPPLPLLPHCHHTPTATTTTLPPNPNSNSCRRIICLYKIKSRNSLNPKN